MDERAYLSFSYFLIHRQNLLFAQSYFRRTNFLPTSCALNAETEYDDEQSFL